MKRDGKHREHGILLLPPRSPGIDGAAQSTAGGALVIPVLSDDGTTWLGTAALVRAPDAGAARALLTLDAYVEIEVHSWQFGGRR
jgi:hypothetical protein